MLTTSFTRNVSEPREIDIELITFVERYVTNLARWDLLSYFGQNPTTLTNALGLAREIGRNKNTVQKELDDLSFLGVLRASENGKGTMYELSRTPQTRRAVIRFSRCSEAPSVAQKQRGASD